MSEIAELTDLVSNSPFKDACHECGGSLKSAGECYTTLLGYSGSVDPNHTWEPVQCSKCSTDYIRETKSGNTWLTQEMHVIEGMPSCFESYIYFCKFCGGDVTRYHTDLEGEGRVHSMHITPEGPQYRTFYECADCVRKIEVAPDV